MNEKRYTVEMAIYKRREGSSNIGVNYIRDNYSKNNKMVKCCGRNYVDVEVPESAIVFGDTNRHIINKVCERLNDLNNENEELKEERDYFERKKYEYHNKWNLAHLDNINLRKENEQLKKKILEEIDLEVAYVDETYSDGRMSKEQHNGAIISLRQLREKFE